MTTEELLELLPAGLVQTPEERRAASGVLAPVGAVDRLLARRLERLGELLDPALCPDETVRHLAALVGLDRALGAANAASLAELRKLIPVALELWRQKGTAGSWRSVAASLAASRSLLFDWFYFRTISGSSAMLHTIPGVEVAIEGSYYSYPERVTDLWVSDPSSTVDLDVVARFLEEVRPQGERINLYRAYHVDDMGAGPTQWLGSGAGSWSYDEDLHTLTTTGEYQFVQDLDGFEETPWDTWEQRPGYITSVYLAVTGTGYLRAFWHLINGALQDGYELVIDQAAGTVELLEWDEGSSSSLATVTRPLAAGFAYRWTIAVLPNEALTQTTIRVYWEGHELINVVTPYGPEDGPIAWGSAAASSAGLSQFLHRAPFRVVGPVRVGPTP